MAKVTHDLYFAPASRNNPIDVPRQLKESATDLYPADMAEWTPYDNLKHTVISPVCAENVFGLPLRYDAVPVWGITQRTANGYWSPQRGDHVIFYTGSGNYPIIARVDSTTINEELAEDLWPHYPLSIHRGSDITNPEPWSHIIYFDAVWSAEISDQAIESLRHTRNSTLRRFTRIPENRLKRLGVGKAKYEQWKTSVRSVVLKATRNKSNDLSQAVKRGATDDELLSIALKPINISPDNLTGHAREHLLNCLKQIYPKW